MAWSSIQHILILMQRGISFFGILVILSGVIHALYQYIYYFVIDLPTKGGKINKIRLDLGRILILGLEFIIAADLIGTTTTPDYYTVGIVAIVVIIRTVLSFSLNRELRSLSKTE